MASQHPSAPQRTSGLVHVNVPHATHYSVVGNHLAQHRELSLLAIGLAVHIQSLPTGASVGIKAITDRFPEGELRVAAAMRELEAHGYLKRFNERLPNGRLVPRTISYNRPGADPEPPPETPPPPPAPPASEPEPETRAPAPEPTSTEPEPETQPPAPEPTSTEPAPETQPPAPEPTSTEPAPETQAPDPTLTPTAPPPPRRKPLPRAHRSAADLLSGLHLHDPRLLLAERDVHRLAPGVTAWFERGAHPDAVRRTLCAGLPDQLRHPAGLLAHRLTALIPPPLPAGPPAPDPLQTCEDCDRAFRSRDPGRCRDCRPHGREAA